MLDKYDNMSYNVETVMKKGGEEMAVTSLVLGICSLVFPFIGLGWLSVIVGILGTILGAIGRKDETKKGMATAGMVMSIISVALGIIMWIACAACIGSVASSVASVA